MERTVKELVDEQSDLRQSLTGARSKREYIFFLSKRLFDLGLSFASIPVFLLVNTGWCHNFKFVFNFY